MEASIEQPETKSTSPISKSATIQTASPLLKCEGCGSFYEKRSSGPVRVFSRMMPNHCGPCQDKAEVDWKAQEVSATAERQKKMLELAAERRRESWIRCLGGQEAYEDYTFETYETEPAEIPDQKHRATFRKWKSFMQTVDILKHNVFVYGPVGVGKTHGAIAKARWMLEQGGTVRVLDKFEFIAAVRGNKSYQPEAELLDHIQEFIDLDLLVINDIEDEPNSPKANTIIKWLIDGRSRRRKGGLIFTSNKPPKAAIDYIGKKNVDRMDGKFLIVEIPEETPSMRGILKRRKKLGDK
jgi:DNA replication protein DnaC